MQDNLFMLFILTSIIEVIFNSWQKEKLAREG